METGSEQGISSADIKSFKDLLRGNAVKFMRKHLEVGLQLPDDDEVFGFTFKEKDIRDYLSRATKDNRAYDVRNTQLSI